MNATYIHTLADSYVLLPELFQQALFSNIDFDCETRYGSVTIFADADIAESLIEDANLLYRKIADNRYIIVAKA